MIGHQPVLPQAEPAVSDHAGSPARFGYIDALRAVAAFLVLWMHVSMEYASKPAVAAHGVFWRDFSVFIDSGRLGVVTFFLISGFVIPASLRGPRWAGLKKFAIRRVLRLAPAFWLSIPFGLLILYKYLTVPPLGDILLNFTMVPEWFGARSALPVYWTLHREVAFYLLCALWFVLGLLHSSRWLALVTFVLALEIGTGPRMDLALMHWGALFRQWDVQGRPRGVLLAVLAGLGAWVMRGPCLAFWIGLDMAAPDEFLRGGLAYLLGFGLFVLGTTWFRLESPLLAKLGEISYSLYLFHGVILYLGVWALAQPLVPPVLSQLPLPVYLLGYGTVTTAVSWWIYQLVELPAMRLAKRLTS
jgi:peptidoglycan/LPS O-acetylase OafA/YrhL